MEYRTVRIEDLTTGMILQEGIRTNIGMLLVGRGQEITYPLAVRLPSPQVDQRFRARAVRQGASHGSGRLSWVSRTTKH